MEFRILGPLEVWDGGCEVSLAEASRMRFSPCSSSTPMRSFPLTAIDELWGEDPPERAAAALRVNVSRLRKAVPQDLTQFSNWLLHPVSVLRSPPTGRGGRLVARDRRRGVVAFETTRSAVASADDSRNSEPRGSGSSGVSGDGGDPPPHGYRRFRNRRYPALRRLEGTAQHPERGGVTRSELAT